MNDKNKEKSKYIGFIGIIDYIIDRIGSLFYVIIGFIIKLFNFIKESKLFKFIINIFIIKFIINILKKIFIKVFYPIVKLISNLIKMTLNGGVIDIKDAMASDDSVSSDAFKKTELSEADKAATEAAKMAIIEKKKKRSRLIKRIVFLLF